MKLKSHNTKYRIRISDKLILILRAHFDARRHIVQISVTSENSDGTSMEVKSPTIDIIEAKSKKAKDSLEFEYKVETENLNLEKKRLEEGLANASEERIAFLNNKLSMVESIISYKEELKVAEKNVITDYYAYMKAFYIRRISLNDKKGELSNV